ncbi:MAG: mRNA surveillance protein pelota [Candidatus Aenigmarchaeota archaeon]|nr:mRNA surveillance protein pelota [Candidatus Aenigmarchaeota archaeon]
MKILKKDIKNSEIKILVESLDDLWHLSHIIEIGDIVTFRTFRKTIVKTGGEMKYGDKKPMVLTLRIESSDFQKDTGMFRIGGPILEGPESVRKSAHHADNIEVGMALLIKKGWKAFHIQRIEKAQARKPVLLICVIEREVADFAMVMESGIEMKTTIVNRNMEKMEEFYEEVIKYMESESGYERIVIAGPGFERENIYKYMKEKKSPLARLVILEKSSATGINGINEVMKTSSSHMLKETRISKENEMVEELLKRIKTEGLAVYGPEETKRAIASGAVEMLMISDKKVYDFENLMEQTERQAGEVVIIGSDHEKGEQFLHLGGIAALTRYKLD